VVVDGTLEKALHNRFHVLERVPVAGGGTVVLLQRRGG
jgi:hypothetical protein